MDYGKELIMDLHHCDVSQFTRKALKAYFMDLCELIDMERCKLTWWDDRYTLPWNKQTAPHTTGTSAVQFIITSNITAHTLDLMKRIYINVFSCKEFDDKLVQLFTQERFSGSIVQALVVRRI
ncbi:hypothetical protein LCGC14_0790980 [marine sediment metagenome]|uniref:S-adenosylmethionine decarboxylase proenzyme n=1 Tax=marine sediment metagenome TaxID=412755 RepID=A0A0F9SCI4_9ZZZZ